VMYRGMISRLGLLDGKRAASLGRRSRTARRWPPRAARSVAG
jgi:hypothetical protein